jgi:hypothetical protein
MEYDLLVHEFLDGSLNQAEEDKLFSLLANESEIRNEFKHQLAIKSAVWADLKAINPKADSTLTIFNELGLLLPVAAGAPMAMWSDKIVNFVKLNSGYFLTSALSVIATILVLFSLSEFGILNNNNNLKDNSLVQKNISSNIPNDLASGKNISSNQSENFQTQKNDEKIIYKYIYVNKNSEDVADKSQETVSDNSYNKLYTNSNINFVNFPDIMYESNNVKFYTNEDVNSKNMSNLLEGNYYPNNSFFRDNSLNLTLELRGSNYFMQENSMITSSDKLSMMNTGIVFLYNFSDEFQLGLDYRREQFYQEFSGVENGGVFKYQQKPDFETISLAGKYNPNFAKFNIFSPYIYAGIGVNPAGPVTRMMLGIDTYLSEYYYLSVGYDYNRLFYTQSGSIYSSSKSGIHFGAGFKF